jgi:hypothetical protein
MSLITYKYTKIIIKNSYEIIPVTRELKLKLWLRQDTEGLSVEEHEVIRRVVLALYRFGIYRP